jgi:uncharacterized protein (TIGR03435 family)
MVGRWCVGVVLACGLAVGQAQDAAKPAEPAAGLTFDVASVRPSEQLDPAKIQAAMQAGKMPKFGADVEGLSAQYSQMQLRDLIANAYGVKPYQVTGPDTINGQRFDIAARMPEGSKPEDAPAMLQALLKDRFHLQAVKSAQEHSVLALVVAKGGPKLKESAEKPVPLDPNAELKEGEMKISGPFGPMIVKQGKDGTATANMGEQGRYTQHFDGANQMLHLEGSAVSMKGLAQMLTQFTMAGPGAGGRQVVDQTGLTGYYEVTIDISLAAMMAQRGGGAGVSGDSQAAQDPGGGLSLSDTVLKMGLKLESSKAQVDQVVVSHIEKMPTEN